MLTKFDLKDLGEEVLLAETPPTLEISAYVAQGSCDDAHDVNLDPDMRY